MAKKLISASEKYDVLLEAEVPPPQMAKFEKRYFSLTKKKVSPSSPKSYMRQPNKRGIEMRLYFNDPGAAVAFAVFGVHIDISPKRQYKKSYKYRVSNNQLCWKLIKQFGFRLGEN